MKNKIHYVMFYLVFSKYVLILRYKLIIYQLQHSFKTRCIIK